MRRNVKAFPEGPQRRPLGQRKTPAPFPARIPGQPLAVLRAIPADGLPPQQGFAALAFRAAALTLLERDMGAIWGAGGETPPELAGADAGGTGSATGGTEIPATWEIKVES